VVTNITKNSISLAWKKYFDGGEPQRFRVRFRKDSMDPTYKYVETDLVNIKIEEFNFEKRCFLIPYIKFKKK
jgi:hypothetical protein